MADEASNSVTPDVYKTKCDQTMERLKASAKWLHDNFWEEWKDAFRSYEVRTEKILFPKGHPKQGQEDTTRTNVAMPELFIGVRRKATRKAKRPPTVKVRESDPQVAEMLPQVAT